MPFILKQTTGLVALALLLQVMVPRTQAAESGPVMLSFEPHCAEDDRSTCPVFEVADADHLKTLRMAAGDILDIDVVLTGGAGKDVQTVRAWINYDPAVLEARNVELRPVMHEPIPGEQSIDKTGKVVKIGANVSAITSGRIAVARVTFRVLSTKTDTLLAFSQFLPDGSGQVSVNGVLKQAGDSAEVPCISKLVGCRGVPTPLLSTEPSKLTVVLTDGTQTVHPAPGSGSTTGTSSTDQAAMMQAAQTALQSKSGSTVSSSAPAATPPTQTGNSSFGLLQVQTLQVTTRDRQIFLGWQALKSSELAGYYVYYGTVSGQYIERRAIPKTATSFVLRDLEPGTTYYFAVRAVSVSEQESLFSQEVSVTVGKPETSTSPFSNSVSSLTAPGNPITKAGGNGVTGKTGIGDEMILLALIAAAIGTGLAAIRQMRLPSPVYAAR